MLFRSKLLTLITWSQDLLLEGSKSKQSLSRVRLAIEETVPGGRAGNRGMPRKTQSRFVTGQRDWGIFKQYNIWDSQAAFHVSFWNPSAIDWALRPLNYFLKIRKSIKTCSLFPYSQT